MSESLARRVFREKRGTALALIVLAVGNAALYAGVVYPLRHRVATADQRAASAVSDLAAAERQHQLARDIVAGKDRAQKELRRFYEEILPADQSAARRITYLRLADLASDAGLRFDRRTFTVEEERESALRRLDITMMLGGPYGNIRRFIHDLERANEFVIISGVELVQTEQREDPSLTLQLATFYRVATDGS